MVLQTLDSLGPLHGNAIDSVGTAQPAPREVAHHVSTSAGRRQLATEKDDWDRMGGISHALLHGEA